MRRVPIKSFLLAARKLLQEPITPSNPRTFVVGNESADVDSICSAITYAYIRTYTSSPTIFHIPLANLPASDLKLRTELSPILSKLNISQSDILTRSDLPPQSEWPSKLQPEATRWILVDHNALTGTLAAYADRVVGCIDHHVDEGSVPTATGPEPRIIEVSGSCTSLVINYFRDQWTRNEFSHRGEERKEMDAEVAWLGLAPVLIDTQCLENESKVTEHDVKAAEFLESILASAKVEYKREEYHQEIYDAKQDISHLSIRDILRKDYKLWVENGLNIGIACSVQPLAFLIEKAGSFGRLCAELETFSEERELGLSAIMTAFTPQDGEFARELMVVGRSREGKAALVRFQKDSEEALGLEELRLGEVRGEMRVWRQRRVECSRKQVAPLLRQSVVGAKL